MSKLLVLPVFPCPSFLGPFEIPRKTTSKAPRIYHTSRTLKSPGKEAENTPKDQEIHSKKHLENKNTKEKKDMAQALTVLLHSSDTVLKTLGSLGKRSKTRKTSPICKGKFNKEFCNPVVTSVAQYSNCIAAGPLRGSQSFYLGLE